MAVLTSAGQIVFGFLLEVEAYRTKSWPLPLVPGLSRTVYYGSRLSNSDFSKDRLILLKYGAWSDSAPRQMVWHYEWYDPESDQMTPAEFTVTGAYPYMPVAYLDRLQFNSGTNWIELIDGKPQPAVALVTPTQLPNGNRFLLDGRPAIAGPESMEVLISKLVGTRWENDSVVALPSRDREWTIDGVTVDFRNMRRARIINDGDRLHLFVDVRGPIVYRAGLDLRRIVDPARTGPLPGVVPLDDGPVSALVAENSEAAVKSWSLINPTISPEYDQPSLLATLVGGQPALLLINRSSEATASGTVRRFDGATWSDLATIDFPFGAGNFRLHTSQDRQRSYLFMSTSLGTPYGFRIDTNGIHSLPLKSVQWGRDPVLNSLRGYAAILGMTTFLGIIFGGTTWLAMQKWAVSQYEFGMRIVALASLGRRGIARLIDLLLLVATTAILFVMMTRDLDWRTLTEALNLRLPHSAVIIFTRAAGVAILWLACSLIMTILAQACWGVTPGKWCCGLRTLRLTLKPCGLARSLAREVVMCVDTCNMLCWTPGILCIALSDRRQRLGDLVADTIVVEARSLR